MSYWRQPLDSDRIRITYGIVHIIAERCKGCGFCVEFCPRDIFLISSQPNSKGYHPPEVKENHRCINCGLCELLCPDFAIYVEEGDAQPPEKIVPIVKHGQQG